MTKPQDTAGKKPKALSKEQQKPRPHSPEEARVWQILDQARQNVKPIVKKEKEAEVLTSELLNLRLKVH